MAGPEGGTAMPLSAERALVRALTSAFAAAGAEVIAESAQSRPWASVTFSGARHVVALRLAGPEARRAADIVLSDLCKREFPLAGHILIDIALEREKRDGEGVQLVLEALTIEAD